MDSPRTFSTVLISCPNKKVARNLAHHLVSNKLAACGQLVDIESIYTWEGKIHEEPEILLILKSRTELFEQIKEATCKIHPYKVPQITQLPISNALPAYLDWIKQNTTP